MTMFEECEFEWKILQNTSYCSKTFPGGQSNFQWHLVSEIFSSYHLISVMSVAAPPGKIKVTCKYSSGSNFRIVNDEFIGGKSNKSMMKIKVISTDLAGRWSAENNTLYRDGGNFYIKVNIWAYFKTAETKKQSTSELLPTSLLSSMLKNDDFCDLEINTETSSFKAHKCVLATISPVFQAMLLNNMKEKQSNCIVITGFADDIIEKMIDFIYHGDVDSPDCSTVLELLKISDIYNIESLKHYCVNHAKVMINDDNVIPAILQGDLNNAMDLKNYAIYYFIHHMKPHSPEEFQEIMKYRPDLLLTLISKMSEKFSTEDE